MNDYLQHKLAYDLKDISEFTLTFANAIKKGKYSIVSVEDEDLDNNKFSTKFFFDTIQNKIKSVISQYY